MFSSQATLLIFHGCEICLIVHKYEERVQSAENFCLRYFQQIDVDAPQQPVPFSNLNTISLPDLNEAEKVALSAPSMKSRSVFSTAVRLSQTNTFCFRDVNAAKYREEYLSVGRWRNQPQQPSSFAHVSPSHPFNHSSVGWISDVEML